VLNIAGRPSRNPTGNATNLARVVALSHGMGLNREWLRSLETRSGVAARQIQPESGDDGFLAPQRSMIMPTEYDVFRDDRSAVAIADQNQPPLS
jgi:hypothetical protein